jgi:hypothetical protein
MHQARLAHRIFGRNALGPREIEPLKPARGIIRPERASVMDKPHKQFNLVNLTILHQRIAVLKVKADEGKKITPKDINEIASIMEHVAPELQRWCNPVDPKEYGG